MGAWSQRVPNLPPRGPTRPGRSSADRRQRRARRHARLDALAVGALTVLTVLLWVVAGPATRDGISRIGADTVSAQVTHCPQDRLPAPPCEVTFEQQGAAATGVLRQGALFGAEPGERIEVYPAVDGTVALAGWRGFAEHAMLLLLALALTSYTLRRWTRLRPPRGGERSADPEGSGWGARWGVQRRDAGPSSGRGSRAYPAA